MSCAPCQASICSMDERPLTKNKCKYKHYFINTPKNAGVFHLNGSRDTDYLCKFAVMMLD